MPGPRAVADTNVLVAAALTPRGLCGRLLADAVAGRWQLVVSPVLLDELAGVLAREKFRRWMTEDEAVRFVDDVRTVADVVPDPPLSTEQVSDDPDGEFLVVLAAAADVVALISGDPDVNEVEGLDPPAVTPAVFAEMLATR